MQVALFNIMALNHQGETPAIVMDATKEAVARADALGFDVAWFAEHHFSSFSICASPTLMAMHCAGFTRRIRLGPGVLVLPLHAPLRLLKEIGMLDHASGGRAVIGIGTGHQPHEFRSLGASMDTRHARFMESWDVLEMGLRHGRVAYEGNELRIPETHLAIGPVGAAAPELFVATHDPRVMARAAQAGAVVFTSPGFRPVEAAVAQRAQVMEAAGQRGSRGGGGPARRAALRVRDPGPRSSPRRLRRYGPVHAAHAQPARDFPGATRHPPRQHSLHRRADGRVAAGPRGGRRR